MHINSVTSAAVEALCEGVLVAQKMPFQLILDAGELDPFVSRSLAIQHVDCYHILNPAILAAALANWKHLQTVTCFWGKVNLKEGSLLLHWGACWETIGFYETTVMPLLKHIAGSTAVWPLQLDLGALSLWAKVAAFLPKLDTLSVSVTVSTESAFLDQLLVTLPSSVHTLVIAFDVVFDCEMPKLLFQLKAIIQTHKHLRRLHLKCSIRRLSKRDFEGCRRERLKIIIE